MNMYEQGAGPSLAERPNLKETVAARLRELIFSGNLRPGTKIDQDALAAAMGVSKLPVREALITLQTEGLIDNVPRRGAYVAPLNRTDVADHFNVYGMVSGLAAERAATLLSGEQLELLEDLAARMEASTSPAEQEELNFQFHRIINRVGVGDSRRLRSVLRLLARSLPTRFFLFSPGWAGLAHTDHREILKAFHDRDAQGARDAMEKHLRDSAEYAVRSLEAAGFWSDDRA